MYAHAYIIYIYIYIYAHIHIHVLTHVTSCILFHEYGVVKLYGSYDSCCNNERGIVCMHVVVNSV